MLRRGGGSELTQEDGEFVGRVAKVRQETGLHLERGDAGRVAAEIDGGDAASIGCKDGDGERTEADLVFLVAESIAIALDVAKDKAEFVH